MKKLLKQSAQFVSEGTKDNWTKKRSSNRKKIHIYTKLDKQRRKFYTREGLNLWATAQYSKVLLLVTTSLNNNSKQQEQQHYVTTLSTCWTSTTLCIYIYIYIYDLHRLHGQPEKGDKKMWRQSLTVKDHTDRIIINIKVPSRFLLLWWHPQAWAASKCCGS